MSSYPAIRAFLKPPEEGGAYTSERLAMLLAHAEDGKLSYSSCCCLIGIPTADHALRGAGESESPTTEPHFVGIRMREGRKAAEKEFFWMPDDVRSDEERRAKLIPLIREEMERRNGMNSELEHVESRESFAYQT